MRATEGLLAQSVGGWIKRPQQSEGGQLCKDLASTQLAGPGALKQWVATKQQAVDTECALTSTHILCASALLACL